MKLTNLVKHFSSLSCEEQVDFISNYRIQRELDIQNSLTKGTKKRKKETKVEVKIASLSTKEQELFAEMLEVCPDLKKLI